jgi:hypothetical protein
LYFNSNNSFLDAVRYLLEKNILCGDELIMKTDEGMPIVFMEGAMVDDNKMQHLDFIFSEILEASKQEKQYTLLHRIMQYDKEAYRHLFQIK